MAQRFYGLNNLATRNRNEDVLTGTVTQNTDIEVRIDDTKAWTRQRIYEALEALDRRILAGNLDLPSL